MTECYSLSRHLDSAAAPPLAADLLALRGAPLRVDGSAVAFVGALGMQVLISAQRQWQEDATAFHIHPVSPALAAAAIGLGVDLAATGAELSSIPNMEHAQ